MRGKRVVARTYSGRPVILRVWEEDETRVYLVTDELFGKMERHVIGDVSVGFPRCDVFELDSSRLDNDAAEWRSMRPYDSS